MENGSFWERAVGFSGHFWGVFVVFVQRHDRVSVNVTKVLQKTNSLLTRKRGI